MPELPEVETTLLGLAPQFGWAKDLEPVEGALEALFWLEEAGVSLIKALRPDTSDAARAIGLGQKTGQIRAGFQANLIPVAGNPLEVSTVKTIDPPQRQNS